MAATKYVGCVSTVVGVTSRCDVASCEIMVATKYAPPVSSVGVRVFGCILE